MNKTAIKNFSIWARNKLIDGIKYRAGLLGITENGIQEPVKRILNDDKKIETEFYDIGAEKLYPISGKAIEQRKNLVKAIRAKEQDTDYKTAYQYIIEETAYTWFNRLIAIRFMEVNDYLPSRIRVLSSESGKLEPDLVTTPFDAGLSFTADEEQTIMQLQQNNRMDELFQLLFIKQCNALNEVLPGLFEQTADYTELLLSVSVADTEGVVYRLVHDIPEEDWTDQVQIIGWLYQYYNSELKDETFALLKKNVKITKERIPPATQLFTPIWIVQYMVENSLGRLWIEEHPNDDLKANWKYYLDEAEQEPSVQAQLSEIRQEYTKLKPEDIRCIDPCMGSGNILCCLFDVLMQIYESCGWSRRDAAQSIIQHNLYGLDIDGRATQLAYFSVMMKARQYDRRFLTRNLQPHVYATTGDAEGKSFGSLVTVNPAEYADQNRTDGQVGLWDYRRLLSQKYHVVVTNPPYMATSNLDTEISDSIKKNFPDEKADLFACFMERCREMVEPNGFQAMITQHAWMFLSSYEKARGKIRQIDTINLLHLGARAFEEIGGEVVQTTSFVMRKSHIRDYKGTYCRLVEPTTQDGKKQMFLSGENRYTAKQDNFSKIPGAPVAYWVSEKLYNAFEKGILLEKIAHPKKGLATTDNNRFLRLWFEVDRSKVGIGFLANVDAQKSGRKWFPLNKGGEYRRWYGNKEYVINWYNDGSEIKAAIIKRYNGGSYTKEIRSEGRYFGNSITWSALTAGTSSFRLSDYGALFDSAGSSMFPEQGLLYILALMNTKVTNYILNIINPTLNYGAGSVAQIPVIIDKEQRPRVEELAKENIDLSREDWDSFETSWDFQIHPIVLKAFSRYHWGGGDVTIEHVYEHVALDFESRFQQLKENEEELNRIFIDIYGLQDELTPEVADKDVTVRRADLGRDIRSLISYAVGCMFGRYSLDCDGLAYAGGEWDGSKYKTFRPVADNIILITDEEYFDDDIVGLFCAWLKEVFGSDTLEENLDYIAKSLGNKGNSSREIICNYFLTDFFKDHCQTYSVTGSGKRPIYWLFDSGKQNGFKAMIYLHRYTADTIGNLRIDYLHRLQHIYRNEIDRMQDTIDNMKGTRQAAVAAKRKEKLQKQLKECREYDERIGHLALSRIELDLDDGVKVNYRKIQTAKDGKFYEILADSKNIMAKK